MGRKHSFKGNDCLLGLIAASAMCIILLLPLCWMTINGMLEERTAYMVVNAVLLAAVLLGTLISRRGKESGKMIPLIFAGLTVVLLLISGLLWERPLEKPWVSFIAILSGVLISYIPFGKRKRKVMRRR